MAIYKYAGKVIKVIDGDSLWAELDLGLRVYVKTKLRLKGIKAPELDEPGGLEWKANLEALLPPESIVTVTIFRQTYDRWEANVYGLDGALVNPSI